MSGTGDLTAGQQWAVVAAIAVSLVAMPLLVVVWPPTFLPFDDAFLSVAFVPGLVMGVLAVVAALASGARRER